MADFKLSANIEVRKQAPLDDRLAKLTKADLIKPESWASDNGTYYVYDYMLVGTSDGLFMLVDKTKILSSDYSGWKRIGNEATPTGGLSESEVKGLIDQALGIVLDGYVQKVDGKGLSTNDYTNEDKTKLDGLSNYDDTTINEQIQGLRDSLNTLVGGDTSSAIESFNEIVAFLASIEDTQTLGGVINGINQAIAEVEAKIPTVPTKISELENDSGFITSEAIPDLSECAKKSDIPTKTSQLENDSNFLTEHQSLEHLATKDELASKQDVIEDLDAIREGSQRAIPTKVSELENDKNYLTEHQDISNLVTKSELDEVESKIPSIDGLASTQYVDDAIANIQIPETPEVDLTPYATKTYVDEKIESIEHPTVDLDPYLTKEDAELTYATKDEVPSIDGLATQTYVDEAIAGIEHPTVDLTDYAKKEDIPSIEGLASETYVDEAIKSIEIPTVDLTGYATEEWVEGKGYLTEHQDISHLATKDELKNKQDVISDLESIREGASLGSTAIQMKDLSDYATKEDLKDILGGVGPKDYLMAIELSEEGDMVLTYGQETNLSDGYISDYGELILEFNYE